MDMVQLTIIAVVVVLILATIGYYLYQEAKFKKMVENNFNQATHDVIVEENKAFTLDGIDTHTQPVTGAILQKDVAVPAHEHAFDTDPLFDLHEAASSTVQHEEPAQLNLLNVSALDENKPDLEPPFVAETPTQEEVLHPENSVEAFFADIYKEVPFPFHAEVNPDLDFIVDIGFEEIKKIKVIPDVSQFTSKLFKFYVLDKNNQWSIFTRGEKYAVRALKLVVQLVDKEGMISQAQLSNIFNELHKFVMQNEAHIYRSDYEAAIAKIQNQLRHLEKVELNLNLFIITQDQYSFTDLTRFFGGLGLIENNGFLQLVENGNELFKISAENDMRFSQGKSYDLLQISAKLHLQKDPGYVVEKIFDCAEKVMQSFESRLLTANKQILGQKDYNAIVHHVKGYMDQAKTNGVEVGGELIRRLF